jgi:hypothetical protein
MVQHHQFLFTKGYWIGEGRVTFNASPDILKFYTRWVISPQFSPSKSIETVSCFQEVEMQGTEEHIKNQFNLFNVSADAFIIELENDLIGRVSGTGLFDAKKIAWEFKAHPTFEGFEVYELQENGDYLFHAEYVSPDQFRSVIDGRIWLKEPSTTEF